jgi:hypothetical protein
MERLDARTGPRTRFNWWLKPKKKLMERRCMKKKLTNMEYERRDPQLLGALENQCKERNKKSEREMDSLVLEVHVFKV